MFPKLILTLGITPDAEVGYVAMIKEMPSVHGIGITHDMAKQNLLEKLRNQLEADHIAFMESEEAKTLRAERNTVYRRLELLTL